MGTVYPTPAAAVAKGALRRLVQAQLEPTPENYARAYAEESGLPPASASEGRAQGAAWAALIERIATQVQGSSPQWTLARRKASLQRVLDGSRADATRLLQRLQSLLAVWESDKGQGPEGPGLDTLPVVAGDKYAGDDPAGTDCGQFWTPLLAALTVTVRAGLPEQDPRARELAERLARLADGVSRDGANPLQVKAIAEVCDRIQRLFSHRHHLVDQLAELCRELGSGLAELSEDESWARGQCDGLQLRLSDGLSVHGLRAARELLAETRQHQKRIRGERNSARDALKELIQRMISEVDELGEHTGRFQNAVGHHAGAVARADSLDSLTDVVKAMLVDSGTVNEAVTDSRQRLNEGQTRASELEDRVRSLEGELSHLSDEVLTDALTQVANRRGLAQAFATECARSLRDGDVGQDTGLALALIDIDNFKRLNDSLGHAAGDVALSTLAQAVRARLRPVDHLARFGGEEFVVLLPKTALAEAQQALSRLQRALTASLFMHEGQDVFVTFSAGVTLWRAGESLESTIERADDALYEAKRAGKNRTCIA